MVQFSLIICERSFLQSFLLFLPIQPKALSRAK